MISIKAEFLNFNDVTVQYLHRAVGVYIIWESGGKRHPKYIGQGKLLQRLADSEIRCEDFWEGLICVTGFDDEPETIENAKLIENVILHIAKNLDRSPEDNVRVEYRSIVDAVEEHNLVRINVEGRNPLLDPGRPMLPRKMPINIRWSKEENQIEIEHEFR